MDSGTACLYVNPPSPTLASCVTLEKSLNFPVPQSPHLIKGDGGDNTDIVGINELTYIQA